MARLVTTVQRYIGTAAERAAMTAATRNSINPGSTFFTTDTGLLYVLDGGDPHTWQLKQTPTTSDPGGIQDLRGVAGDRPAFGDVEVGTTYWSVDTGDVHVSDGTAWVVV